MEKPSRVEILRLHQYLFCICLLAHQPPGTYQMKVKNMPEVTLEPFEIRAKREHIAVEELWKKLRDLPRIFDKKSAAWYISSKSALVELQTFASYTYFVSSFFYRELSHRTPKEQHEQFRLSDYTLWHNCIEHLWTDCLMTWNQNKLCHQWCHW